MGQQTGRILKGPRAAVAEQREIFHKVVTVNCYQYKMGTVLP